MHEIEELKSELNDIACFTESVIICGDLNIHLTS